MEQILQAFRILPIATKNPVEAVEIILDQLVEHSSPDVVAFSGEVWIQKRTHF